MYSAIALSDRKQQKKLAEMDDNIKAISRALVFQNHQSQNSSNSGVPGVVVSVGGQSVSEAEQPSLLTEDDRTKQPSLPEFNRLREEKDRANLEAATYKKKQEALEAENRSLLKQLQAHSSKRVKRPEDVRPSTTRMPPHVLEKQKRAEEQSIALKVKGRNKKSEILESSNLPTPYKSKLRSRSNK